MKYYVYALIDPRNQQPFYIGKGKGKRIDQHEKEAKDKHKGTDKCVRIRDIWAAALVVEKTILEDGMCEKTAYQREKEIIKEIGLERLTNVSPGGAFPIIARLSNEHLDKEWIEQFLRMMTMECFWDDKRESILTVMALDGHRRAADVVERRGISWLASVLQKVRCDWAKAGQLIDLLSSGCSSNGG